METVPNSYKDIGYVTSNFDFSVEEGAEEKLKSGNYYGKYPTWNFLGKIWYDKETKMFKCQVDIYGKHVCTAGANSIKELMEMLSSEFM